MKLSVDRKLLLDALRFAVRAIPSRTALPILSCFYFEAQDDELRVFGSDLEQWAACRVPADVEEPGNAVLNAHPLLDLVSALYNEEEYASTERKNISFETKDRYQLVLRAKNQYDDAEYQLLGLPPDQYPPIPEVEAENEFVIPAKDFRRMLKLVEFAVSHDELRQTLCGIRMELNGRDLRMVATDSFRLALCDTRIEDGTDTERQIGVIVPYKAVPLLLKLPAEGNITVRLGNKQAAFVSENASVFTQLIEGTYPNYQKVIPDEFVREWNVDPAALRVVLRRASMLSKDSGKKVYFQAEDGKLVITSQGDTGSAKEIIPAGCEPDGFQIAFNASYILDLLDVYDWNRIIIESNEPHRVCRFRPANNTDYFCLVMPMAI